MNRIVVLGFFVAITLGIPTAAWGKGRRILVPDVVDLPQSEAEAAIIDAGLRVGTISEDYSDTIVLGNVISQDPVAGDWLMPRGYVNLVISIGSPVVEGMVWIPGGTFEMGDHFTGGDSIALPIHTVTLDSFYMSKYEITNQQYCDYLNAAYSAQQIKVVSDDQYTVVYAADDAGNSFPYCNTHSFLCSYSQIDYLDGIFEVRFKGDFDMSNHPMIVISWYGSVAYCNWRSEQEGLESCYNLSTWECDFTKNGYRLPTEAEWEYAARGGEHNPYYRFPWGNSIDCSMANYGWDSCGDSYETIQPFTTPVGYYDGGQVPAGVDMANGYGLYDVAGNVFEWCNDWYGSYSSSPETNPTGPASGISRIFRGGGWGMPWDFCQVGVRSGNPPDTTNFAGFRVVLDLE